MLTIFYFHFFITSFLFTLTTIILYTFSVYKSRKMLELFFYFYFHNSFTFPILILLLYHKRRSLSRDKVVKTFSFLGLFTLLWKRFHFFSSLWKRLHWPLRFYYYESAYIFRCRFYALWKRFHFLLLLFPFMKTLSFFAPRKRLHRKIFT